MENNVAVMRSVGPDDGLEDGLTIEESCCQLCGSQLGKRRLNPRHHCRICSKAVCANCSPNSIQDGRQKEAQRVCTGCGSEAWKVPIVLERFGELSGKLLSLGHEACTFAPNPGSLENAITILEGTLGPLEQARDAHRATSELLASRTQTSKSFCLELWNGLSRLCGEDPTMIKAEDQSLDDLMASCKQAYTQVECMVAREREAYACLDTRATKARDACATLGGSLHELCGSQFACDSPSGTLEEAVAMCKSALQPLQALQSKLQETQQSLQTMTDAHMKLEGQASISRDALLSLGDRLHCLVGAEAPTARPQATSVHSEGLCQAVSFCEASAGPLERLAQNDVAARATILEFGDRLHALTACPPPFRPKTGRIEDAVKFCEAALLPLQAAQDVHVQTKSKLGETEQVLNKTNRSLSELSATRDQLKGEMPTREVATLEVSPTHQEKLILQRDDKIQSASLTLLQFAERLHTLVGGPSLDEPNSTDLEESTAFCEMALSHAEMKFVQLQSAEQPSQVIQAASPQRWSPGSTPRSPTSPTPMRASSTAEQSTMLASRASSTLDGFSPPGRSSLCASTETGDPSRCYVCSSLLGKRRLNPRHHCRVCAQAVCGSCSASSVVFAGQRGLNRACTPCVAVVRSAPAAVAKLANLAESLYKIGDSGLQPSSEQSADTLEKVVADCETAFGRLLRSSETR